jgi:type VI protein secretion system component VasK
MKSIPYPIVILFIWILIVPVIALWVLISSPLFTVSEVRSYAPYIPYFLIACTTAYLVVVVGLLFLTMKEWMNLQLKEVEVGKKEKSESLQKEILQQHAQRQKDNLDFEKQKWKAEQLEKLAEILKMKTPKGTGVNSDLEPVERLRETTEKEILGYFKEILDLRNENDHPS